MAMPKEGRDKVFSILYILFLANPQHFIKMGVWNFYAKCLINLKVVYKLVFIELFLIKLLTPCL